MEKELDLILDELSEGNMTLVTLKARLLSLYNVMPCLPTDIEISKAADEWEKKASCGIFEGGYVNEDFIAGINWLKSFINKA
jgi:hypothetical protein